MEQPRSRHNFVAEVARKVGRRTKVNPAPDSLAQFTFHLGDADDANACLRSKLKQEIDVALVVEVIAEHASEK
jgi:hypothetical protein